MTDPSAETATTAVRATDPGEDSPPTDPSSVVDAYHQAWTGGHVDVAMRHLSDDVRCAAPDEQVSTKEDWRAYLTAFIPLLTGTPEHARLASGDHVALWYYPQTATTKTTLASELFTVRGGQITEIHLAFDRLGYLSPGQETP